MHRTEIRVSRYLRCTSCNQRVWCMEVPPLTDTTICATCAPTTVTPAPVAQKKQRKQKGMRT